MLAKRKRTRGLNWSPTQLETKRYQKYHAWYEFGERRSVKQQVIQFPFYKSCLIVPISDKCISILLLFFYYQHERSITINLVKYCKYPWFAHLMVANWWVQKLVTDQVPGWINHEFISIVNWRKKKANQMNYKWSLVPFMEWIYLFQNLKSLDLATSFIIQIGNG